MSVLYGSYDRKLESKVQEIIGSEGKENQTEPGRSRG